MPKKTLQEKAIFCKDKCAVCRRARTKGGFARWFVKYLDSPICPYCKAYKQLYGHPAWEQIEKKPAV